MSINQRLGISTIIIPSRVNPNLSKSTEVNVKPIQVNPRQKFRIVKKPLVCVIVWKRNGSAANQLKLRRPPF